jgi:hypothetical protein
MTQENKTIQEQVKDIRTTLKARIIPNLPISKEVTQSKDNEIRDFVTEKIDKFEFDYYFKQQENLVRQKQPTVSSKLPLCERFINNKQCKKESQIHLCIEHLELAEIEARKSSLNDTIEYLNGIAEGKKFDGTDQKLVEAVNKLLKSEREKVLKAIDDDIKSFKNILKGPTHLSVYTQVEHKIKDWEELKRRLGL